MHLRLYDRAMSPLASCASSRSIHVSYVVLLLVEMNNHTLLVPDAIFTISSHCFRVTLSLSAAMAN